NSQNTSGTNTLSGHLGFDRNLTINQSAGGTLNITQARASVAATTTGMDIKGFTLTVSGGGNVTIGTGNTSFGTIYNSTGTGGLVMAGTGTLTINDSGNTYAGSTTVKSGTLLIGGGDISSTQGTLGGTGRTVLLG